VGSVPEAYGLERCPVCGKRLKIGNEKKDDGIVRRNIKRRS